MEKEAAAVSGKGNQAQLDSNQIREARSYLNQIEHELDKVDTFVKSLITALSESNCCSEDSHAGRREYQKSKITSRLK